MEAHQQIHNIQRNKEPVICCTSTLCTSLAIEHHFLHIFFEGWQWPHTLPLKCAPTQYLACVICWWVVLPHVRLVRLHVESSSESRQVCIICRRNCGHTKSTWPLIDDHNAISQHSMNSETEKSQRCNTISCQNFQWNHTVNVVVKLS